MLRDAGLIPGQGTKIPHTVQHEQNLKKRNQHKNPYKNPGWFFFFCRNQQTTPKIHVEKQESQNSQNNPANEEQIWRTHISEISNHTTVIEFQNLITPLVIKAVW